MIREWAPPTHYNDIIIVVTKSFTQAVTRDVNIWAKIRI